MPLDWVPECLDCVGCFYGGLAGGLAAAGCPFSFLCVAMFGFILLQAGMSEAK